MSTTTQSDFADDHVAYVNGQLEPYEDFPFDEIERRETEQLFGFVKDAPEDVRQLAAELWGQTLAWMWTQAGIKSATIKLVALTAGLRPDLLGDRAYLQLANEMGVTKAAIPAQSIRFQTIFGVKVARSRSEEGRANMRAARLNQGGVSRRTKRKPADAEVIDTSHADHPENQSALARQAHAEFEAMFEGGTDGEQ